ncbi:glucosyltransferase [Trapelia coarctata]|nr:glucosyltransferase [Trapelia coarctata]
MERVSKKANGLPFMPAAIVINGILLVIAGYWFYKVSNVVPEPYLDEVFHIRQALEYWSNRWHVWDSKITTPPGLYVVSYVWLWLLKSLQTTWSLVTQLRSVNLVAGVLVLYYLSRQLLHLIPSQENVSNGSASKTGSLQARPSRALDHAALNICLFPPLFFFFALYYTDVLSVGLVLYAYTEFHRQRNIRVIIASILALTFRQTNIFWTAIYLGGLEVVRNLQKGRTGVEFPKEPNIIDVATISWQYGRLYDPLISEASFEGLSLHMLTAPTTSHLGTDYMKTSISLAVATLANLRRLLPLLLPHLSLLFAFGIFVVWNGGVVLGDKTNHITTLHLPQLLYLCPYISLFSFPLYYPYLLNLLPVSLIPPSRRTGSTTHLLPRLALTLALLTTMFLIIHHNTLIHPFTLADNRHYTFYVFRYLRLWPPARYVVVPLYYITGWCCVVALGGYPVNKGKSGGEKRAEKEKEKEKGKESEALSPSTRASFLLIFLATTALSVITAPLVEPRYFILPWLVWRLHVPSEHRERNERSERARARARARPHSGSWLAKDGYDYRLWLETGWFLIVNGVTGYIFLNWGFSWPQEGGKVQRFMW